MIVLTRLEGHWTGEMLTGLAKRHGVLVAEFLFARADLGLGDEAPEGLPCHWIFASAWPSGPTGLLPPSATRLERAWLWLRQHDGSAGWARYQIGEIFAAMFKLDSSPVVEFLDTMLDRATAGDLRWIGYILSNSHHRFDLQASRLRRALPATDARQWTPSWSRTQLAGSAGRQRRVTGPGTPGEPMPRDIQARDEATEAARNTLAPVARLFPLQGDIGAFEAEHSARSIAEGEALDTDE